MAKGNFYLVTAAEADGICRLGPATAPLTLAPGKWIARLTRVGLADEVVAGSSDRLAAAIAVGADRRSQKAVTGRETTELAARLPAVELPFEIADGAQLPLGLSLVLDRGKAPELIEEFRVQVIAKAPAGTTPAIVTAALTAAFADVAIAVAVASFIAAADRIMVAAFGTSTALARSVVLQGKADGLTSTRLCLTALPDPRSINVGYVPKPTDFAMNPGGSFIETRRARSTLPAAAEGEDWVEAQRSWAHLELIRQDP